ncbi:MAG: AAA family ATPase [Anaerolineae bacterium]|nr:AAA family ATPase [Anaerolineae bacterium]
MAKNNELIQALRAALAAAPDNAPLRKHLGDLLMEAEAYTEAIQEYRQALDLAPDDNDLKLTLARAYHRQGKAEVALVILEQLLRGPRGSNLSDPSLPAPVLLFAARVYLDTHNLPQAARAYRQAIAKDATLADPALEQQLLVPVPEDAPPQFDDKVEAENADEGDHTKTDTNDIVFVVGEDISSTDAIADIERPKVTFKDVGGMEKLKEEIRMKIIYPLIHPEIYEAYGKTAGGGILMYGPPGCGKTYLARATAGEVKVRFLAVGLHDVLDMYIGQSEQNLHKLFELARANTPCILFFDEVDALGASRADMRYSAGRKVINQFLWELDGVNTDNEGVLILAATNAPWHVDSALRRPGRFDRVIFVPPPDPPARATILQLMLANKPTQHIDYARIARETDAFSGADLKGIVDTAVEHKLRDAMKTGLPAPLTTQDLHNVVKTVRPTTQEWFATARNYAIYSNEGGLYNDILDYLKITK